MAINYFEDKFSMSDYIVERTEKESKLPNKNAAGEKISKSTMDKGSGEEDNSDDSEEEEEE